ncbi:ATP-dependent translocase ABCB1 [Caerostris extrusa]|uniref:ATP-dependent translocase ABCB1 n=1 Tax=Caerostris extrusa TaxID=172846 RepID=A0AAV4XGY6_CAEEX|nr:ATP-dependent translocase ABCB1 [Caerostris extrusa]
MEFFDNPKNSVGSLCSRLTSDASSVQGATGSRVSTLLQSLSTLCASIALALRYNIKIGMLVLAFIPFVLVAAYCEGRVVASDTEREKKGTEAASKVAIEAIESIRTVASLHEEHTFYKQFHDALLDPLRKSRLKSHVRGIIYGFAQDLLKVLEGVMLGAMMIGQSVAFAPDYQKAKVSAVRIFKLLDLRPKIDASSTEGNRLEDVKGFINFPKSLFQLSQST